MANNLVVRKGCIFAFSAEGGTYLCSAVKISYEVDKIPSAVVTLGFGDSIRGGGKSQQPDTLISRTLSASDSGKAPLKCTIKVYDYDGGSGRVIFTGIILSALPVLSGAQGAAGASSAMVQVTCAGDAFMLCVASLANYSLASAQNLSIAITKGKIDSTGSGDGIATGGRGTMDATTSEELRKSVVAAKTVDVVAGVNQIINELLAKSSKITSSAGGTTIVDIPSYIDSGATLNIGADDFALSTYYKTLIDSIIGYLPTASVWDILSGILCSMDYMLTLVPRLSGNKLKMRLQPCKAWSGRASVTITASHLIGMQTTSDLESAMKRPNTFVVNFANPLRPEAKDSAGIYTVLGVFSTDGALMSSVANGRGMNGLTQADIKYKLYRAPEWTYGLIRKQLAENTSAQSITDCKTVQEATQKSAEQKRATEEAGIQQMQQAANDVATALFNHIYGSANTITLNLDPALCCGRGSLPALENNLGEIVDVDLSTKLGGGVSLNMRGMLQSVHISYTAGQSTSIDYSATLTRARPQATDSLSLTCPFYKEDK